MGRGEGVRKWGRGRIGVCGKDRVIIFKKYNVLNVFDTFKLELGVFMYKHQNNSLPHTFSDYFIKHSQVHNYPTRNAQDYSIYKAQKVFAD